MIGRIRRLHKERNALVHSHPTYLDVSDTADPTSAGFWQEAYANHHVRPEKAEAAVRTCEDAVDAIMKIAPDFDPDFKSHAGWREAAHRRMEGAARKLGQFPPRV